MRCGPPKKPICKPVATASRSTLASVVRAFRLYNRPDSEKELTFFKEMPSLELAIHHAGNALDWRGKRFGHQCRITRAALRSAVEKLKSIVSPLKACRSFLELHTLLERNLGPLSGIGELYIYDTALRLGSFLDLRPAHVYLHTGTRAGARRLGLNLDRSYIPISEFPAEIRVLPAHEIEDFLCIYKDRLAP